MQTTLAPDLPRHVSRRERSPAVQRTLLVIFVCNLVVVVLKVIVGVRTQSLSVLGAALESGLDALNNLVGMALVAVAARAPDEDHPYGHDKFETLGALAIVGFLSISCFELLREGISQLVRRTRPEPPATFEIVLLAFTAVINIVVVWYERRRGHALNSPFLLADASHTAGDLYVTLLAIASLVSAAYGFGGADPVLAIVVAMLIAYNGYLILRVTVPILVDACAVDSQELRRLLGEIPLVADVRSVRSRSTPSGVLFAEVTIGVLATATVAEAHAVADEVEARISARLGDAEVTVHVEPA